MRRWISVGLIALTAAALAGCDSVSDTGYVGTWARESGKTQSIVSIAREGEGYTFCWSREAVAGLGGRHVCAAPGRTEVYQGPDLAYVYEFTVEKRDGTGDLYVTVRIRVPRDLDDAARVRVEALRDLGPADPRKEMGR